MVETRYINVHSTGQLDVLDITNLVAEEVRNSSVSNGLVNIFCAGSTGAITTVEYEPGLKKDIKDFFNEIIPTHKNYSHHETWGDDNGSSHLQSSLIKTSFTVPIINNSLTLGTWQQIVFIECDTKSRTRRLIVQIIGE